MPGGERNRPRALAAYEKALLADPTRADLRRRAAVLALDLEGLVAGGHAQLGLDLRLALAAVAEGGPGEAVRFGFMIKNCAVGDVR